MFFGCLLVCYKPLANLCAEVCGRAVRVNTSERFTAVLWPRSDTLLGLQPCNVSQLTFWLVVSWPATSTYVFPDPHAKQLSKIMQPFLTKVVEGGDVYNQGK